MAVPADTHARVLAHAQQLLAARDAQIAALEAELAAARTAYVRLHNGLRFVLAGVRDHTRRDLGDYWLITPAAVGVGRELLDGAQLHPDGTVRRS